MPKMTGLERILTALKVIEPDLVPHWEVLIHPKVRDAILSGASYEDFVEYMDLDAAAVYDRSAERYDTIDASKNIVRDHWGAIVRFTSEEIPHRLETPIKSAKDLDSYVPPDPDLPWRYEKLRNQVKRFKGQRAIIPTIVDTFDVVRDGLRGDTDLYRDMIKNPEMVDRMNEIVLKYQLGYIKNCIEVGADIIMVAGDYATQVGPMVSPQHTARFITPCLKRLVDYTHSLGKPCLKHTDGDIWRIADLIVETGINGLHPIDPQAGMDIGEAKAKYGDRICLLGNIDCGRLLCWGTEEEVRQEVKSCIRKAGKGGGLICMSSNTVHSGVKPENYLAMVETIREYGKYPLSLD
jgi:uroporphyrinogen decarboxylase